MTNKQQNNIEEVQELEKNEQKKGMTTKVMKGSFWVLMGQVIPMIATFISSPFVIRYLGAEAYGVLLIISMIPLNFAHADIGMNLASTKYGAEAYANNDLQKEAITIRTAAFVAFFPVFIVSSLLFIFSDNIMTGFFAVKSQYREVASIGLKLTATAFLLSSISNIFNTPQFSRLRMDLNVLSNAVPRVIMICITPFVLMAGFGIVGATVVGFAISLIILILNITVSGKLLPNLYDYSIDKKMVRPLLNFGKNIVLYGLALVFISNLEKILLAKLMDSKASAYYSVAFTLANMASLFSVAMVQTLNPALAQLLAPEKKAELAALFSRCVRLGVIILIPSVLSMLIIAKPFFTIWAGKEFGEESVHPFYVLLIGIVFNLIGFVPAAIIVVANKSILFSKIYYLEMIPYGFLVYFLVSKFGIIGAALAWSIRESINALLFIFFTKKNIGLTLGLSKFITGFVKGILAFIPAILFAILYDNSSIWLLVILPITLAFYTLVVWKQLMEDSEKQWVLKATQKISIINRMLISLK